MRYATPVRMALGFPTIFNLLGPLTNPAGAKRQVMGVYAPHLVELIAGVLADRGCERAMVLHSSDGLDELSIHAPTRIAHVRSGSVVSIETFDPSPLVPSPGDPAHMVAHDLPGAVRMARSVLAGEPGPCSDAVALNAAAALVVADAAGSIEEGFAMARTALTTGAAARTLDALVQLSRQAGP